MADLDSDIGEFKKYLFTNLVFRLHDEVLISKYILYDWNVIVFEDQEYGRLNRFDFELLYGEGTSPRRHITGLSLEEL